MVTGIMIRGLPVPSRLRTSVPGMGTRLLLPLLVLSAAVSFLFWDGMISDLVKGSEGNLLFGISAQCVEVVKVFGKGEVIVLIALLAGLCGHKRLALQMVVALVIPALLVWSLKVTVHRERPRGNSFVSFPSGDAATAAAAALLITAAIPAMLPLAGTVVLAVAAGRILAGAHYPSDVLVGLALGLASGTIATSIGRRSRVPLQPHHFFSLPRHSSADG
jgi:membrane-associated phospholipid phosphatase